MYPTWTKVQEDRDVLLPLGRSHVHVSLHFLPTDELFDEEDFIALGRSRLRAIRTHCDQKGSDVWYLVKKLSCHASIPEQNVLWPGLWIDYACER